MKTNNRPLSLSVLPLLSCELIITGIDAFHFPSFVPSNRRRKDTLFPSKALPRSATAEVEKIENSETVETLPFPLLDNDFVGDNNDLEPDGVICARGVCAVAEEEAPEICYLNDDMTGVVCEPNPDSSRVVQPGFTIAYLWPRALLLICSVLYGTNFPLGRLMNDALPASAATSTRMVLASVALSPFLFRLKPS